MLGQLHKFTIYMPFKVGERAFSLAFNDYVTIDRIVITLDEEGTPLVEYQYSNAKGWKNVGLENSLVDVEKAHHYLKNPLSASQLF